jgi:hypothetical protein
MLIKSTYTKAYKMNEELMQELLYFVNKCTELKYFMYKNKRYKQYSNIWADGDYIDDTPECESYDTCDITKYTNKIVPKHCSDVKYITKRKHTDDNWIEEEMSTIKKNKMMNILLKYDKKSIVFVGINKYVFINTRGFNEDHRGSTHCKLYVKMENVVGFKGMITLYDLIHIFYRLKSHKFDKWYEMYCESKVFSDNNSYIIKLNFDHGS